MRKYTTHRRTRLKIFFDLPEIVHNYGCTASRLGYNNLSKIVWNRSGLANFRHKNRRYVPQGKTRILREFAPAGLFRPHLLGPTHWLGFFVSLPPPAFVAPIFSAPGIDPDSSCLPPPAFFAPIFSAPGIDSDSSWVCPMMVRVHFAVFLQKLW